ncbi:hypothetical protein [Algiphilus aromaticivorans]|uniref:hypothetical protein n=1 Tax=Algiphilus aromaticivorans TaxID=382454 RepID=UPI0012EB5C29|nr:hypothetical protein [Algiphilus aromaticivorans]
MNLQTERIQALCQQLQLDAVAAEYPALADHTAKTEGSHSDFLDSRTKCNTPF